MLITVNNKRKLNITLISVYALQYIYEPQKVSADNVRSMMESVIYWSNHFQTKSELKFDPLMNTMIEVGLSAVEQELYNQLQDVAYLLELNEKGLLEKRKATFKAHSIDYKKFHNLPGAHTPESLAKAKAMKDEYDRQNPEQEGLISAKKKA